MALAHGVEGRFPFLDHRVFEFAARLPTGSKLRVLEEKAILRRWARGIVPDAAARRPKQPYRAPDAPAFFQPTAPSWVEELLSEESVSASGLFEPRAVKELVRRCRARQATGFRENQALVALLSTELWRREFMGGGTPAVGKLPAADVALDEGVSVGS